MEESSAQEQAVGDPVGDPAPAPTAGLARAFGQLVRPAVVEATGPGGTLIVTFEEGDKRSAELALPGVSPRPGDRVLTLSDEVGRVYVVGLLRPPTPPALEDALRATEEAGATEAAGLTEEERRAPTERVAVRDRRGELIFEYDPEEDRATLHAPSGDLEIVVPRGRLELSAKEGVRIASEKKVELVSGTSIELAAEAAGGAARSSLRLHPNEIRVVGAALAAAAERAELLAARVAVKAKSIETTVDRARTEARVIEVRAQRIVERAKDAYREIEGLAQTRAKKVRMVAQKSVQLVGDNALLKARDRMKIKGERIHLA